MSWTEYTEDYKICSRPAWCLKSDSSTQWYDADDGAV